MTIKNGTVAGGAQQTLNVYGSADSSAENYSVLTIASDVTVTADVWGVCMFGPTYNSKPGYGAVINIAGTVHTTGNGKGCCLRIRQPRKQYRRRHEERD